jgi:uncharacterized protein YegP (UPF0339 family)
MYFDLYVNRAGEYQWTLKSANHEPICHSEGYVSKQGALHSIGLVKRGAATASVYDQPIRNWIAA